MSEADRRRQRPVDEGSEAQLRKATTGGRRSAGKWSFIHTIIQGFRVYPAAYEECRFVTVTNAVGKIKRNVSAQLLNRFFDYLHQTKTNFKRCSVEMRRLSPLRERTLIQKDSSVSKRYLVGHSLIWVREKNECNKANRTKCGPIIIKSTI
jgi:hypothetical protein